MNMIVDTIDTSGSSFFDIVFFFFFFFSISKQNQTNEFDKTPKRNLFTAHIVTQCLKLLDSIISL